MGIVSHCPNGHRLKVKDHLAGKKGICPSCGARFRIPLAAASGPTPDPAAAPLAGVSSGSGLPVASIVSLDAARAATLPPALVLSEAPPPPAAIAAAPDALWCLAVPGGEPSDAMSGEALIRRLTSGGMTGEELVWRSDWTDWRPAAAVFPDLLLDGPSPGTAAW
jgi:hypothetical protein